MPNLLADHDCGQEPDKDGRITPGCSRCWEDAHDEGIHMGEISIIQAFAVRMRTAIREANDPLGTPDKSEAIKRWETAQFLIKLVDTVEGNLEKAAEEKRSRHYDRNLHRVMTDEEFAKYEADRAERLKGMKR